MLNISLFNPIALRMAKTLWSFGRFECNRVKLFYMKCGLHHHNIIQICLFYFLQHRYLVSVIILKFKQVYTFCACYHSHTLLLLLCSHSQNDVLPELQKNISMAAEWGHPRILLSGNGLYISTLPAVRYCAIMNCIYMYVFTTNKII